MVIHGLLVTFLDQLALIFNCLKWCFVDFENVLKRGQCAGNLCNDPCWDVYKGVCLLKRFSMFLKVVLKDVLKRGHRCGNLCNDSCLNVYKGVFVF